MTLRSILLVPLALALSLPAFTARADDAPPICTDRPTKANVTCTVPEGMWQLETDVGNYTRDTHDGGSTETLYFVNPYLKYGISSHTDIEVNWAPDVRARTSADGQHQTTNGAGDLFVRVKTNLYTGDIFSASIIPFIKAPTASHGIGNGQWEGGVIVPMSAAVGAGFTLTLGPELDAVADTDGQGHHLSVTNLINLTHSLTSKLSMEIEYWRQDNQDPSGHIKRESGDIAFIYVLNPNLQLDMGANVGLNHATPDMQTYLGLSYRW
ncbi:transporter [Dyella halodurans]|uniref:Transporter n=1 Tax=Dyella halodurans TaxID=1920171 RepID=A0ABV9C003_9GAMM|nr:transporter [Dyella halodurans]